MALSLNTMRRKQGPVRTGWFALCSSGPRPHTQGLGLTYTKPFCFKLREGGQVASSILMLQSCFLQTPRSRLGVGRMLPFHCACTLAPLGLLGAVGQRIVRAETRHARWGMGGRSLLSKEETSRKLRMG